MTVDNRKNRKSVSLTATLSLAFFLLCVVVLVASNVLQIFFYYQTQQDSINNKQQLIARDAGYSVANFMQEKISILTAIGNMINIADISIEKQEQVISRLLGSQPSFRQILIFTPEAKLVTYITRFSGVIFNSFLDRVKSQYSAGMKAADNYISTVFIDADTNEPMVFISIRIKDNLNNTMGIIAVELNLKFTWTLMENLKVGKNGSAYVVDRDGRLIAFRDNLRVLKNEAVSHLKPVRDFMKSTETSADVKSSVYTGIMGETVLGNYVPLITPDWAVITELPWGEAHSEVMRVSVFSFIILLVMAGLAGLSGSFIARRISIPLIDLTGIASRISNGEMSLKADAAGPREIITLAQAFNSMTTQLINKAEGFKKANIFLTEIIEKASKITINLNTFSREIESSAQEQTSGANEQASGITEVSATLEELSITAKQITNSIGELVFASGEVIKLLQQIQQELLQTSTQLDDVGKISTKNTTEIGELNKRSIIINEMVELIKEIASKTNILSINASIEASRSGEAGSGFAVVASEIRELSRETIVSAKNVETAAKDIRGFLDSIVKSAKIESVKVIESGNTVKHVFQNIEETVAKINNNYSFTQRIDTSIKQQESGSKQASDTMRQMAEIARQSAEAARQIMVAVKDIVNLADELNQTVKKLQQDDNPVNDN